MDAKLEHVGARLLLPFRQKTGATTGILKTCRSVSREPERTRPGISLLSATVMSVAELKLRGHLWNTW